MGGPGSLHGTVADCAFCKIVRAEASGELVFEDDLCLAFLDRRPLFAGHCLLIPRAHYETLPDVPGEIVGPLFTNAAMLARAVELAMGAQGTFVAINNRVSQSVPHLHVHIVPRRAKDGLKGFFWPRKSYADGEAVRVRDLVRDAIAKLKP